MRTTINFLRHGKTENPKSLIKGNLPGFPLNNTGIKQSHQLGKWFQDKDITTICFSPLSRCKQTARIIQKYLPEAKFHESRLITEQTTNLTGEPYTRLQKIKSYDEYIKHFEDPYQVAERMKKFCQKILKEYPGQNIVAVSHAAPIQALSTALRNGNLEEKPRNSFPIAGILKIEFEKGKLVDLQQRDPGQPFIKLGVGEKQTCNA